MLRSREWTGPPQAGEFGALTGEVFWDVARDELPGRVLRAYTGTRFVFGA